MYECLRIVRLTTEGGHILRRQKANGVRVGAGGEKSLIKVHRKRPKLVNLKAVCMISAGWTAKDVARGQTIQVQLRVLAFKTTVHENIWKIRFIAL
jgi:hypothetical protein